jgi:hypothetical protein
VFVFFGHLYREEQAVGDSEVDGASARASPRSCSRGRARDSGGPSYLSCERVFPGESSVFRRQR